MSELVTVIKDWPAVVQGALGSALFAVVLYFGQKITSYISAKYQLRSTKRQKTYLYNEMLRLRAMRDGNNIQNGAFYASVLWYRASRELFRALFWLTLGLIFDSIIGIFGIVGYLGCLYYLFMAMNVVRPINIDKEKLDEKISELEKEYNKLINKK